MSSWGLSYLKGVALFPETWGSGWTMNGGGRRPIHQKVVFFRTSLSAIGGRTTPGTRPRVLRSQKLQLGKNEERSCIVSSSK